MSPITFFLLLIKLFIDKGFAYESSQLWVGGNQLVALLSRDSVKFKLTYEEVNAAEKGVVTFGALVLKNVLDKQSSSISAEFNITECPLHHTEVFEALGFIAGFKNNEVLLKALGDPSVSCYRTYKDQSVVLFPEKPAEFFIDSDKSKEILRFVAGSMYLHYIESQQSIGEDNFRHTLNDTHTLVINYLRGTRVLDGRCSDMQCDIAHNAEKLFGKK